MDEQTKTRILYMDDDKEHVADFLRVFGEHYEIFTTNSEQEGLQIAIKNDIGIIVINETMLERECTDMLGVLKTTETGIPVIAIKSEDSVNFDTINGEKGAAAFILKPFTKPNNKQGEGDISALKTGIESIMAKIQEASDAGLPGDQILTTLITQTALLLNCPQAVLYIENCPDCHSEKLTVKTFLHIENKELISSESNTREHGLHFTENLPAEIISSHKIHWQQLPDGIPDVSEKIHGILRIPVFYGTNLYAIMEFYTLTDYTGKLLSLSVMQDLGLTAGFIMERRRLEMELRRAKDESESANKAKSVFLANMSHELRTPLNAVLGFSQVLQKQYFGALNEKQLEYVNDIVESGRHLLSLINDILDLSKVEAGKMELEISRISIREWLEHSLLLIREKSIRHGINLHLDMDPELDMVEFIADERKMKQVMFNILTNASKFTPDGGEIKIEASLIGDLIRVCISDTGIGISEEDRSMIFEKFYKTKSGKMVEAVGSGLGLPLVRSFLEKHGGRIWAESEGEDKGSRFIFEVPLKQ
ncbi:MAG: ATP-binding protein [Firmicutes bacterium]|nr:ATP-binding protein [Bacillota bacterium]